MAFEDLKFVETNPDLIFCFDDILDIPTLSKISNFGWDTLPFTRSKSNGLIKTFSYFPGDLDFLETLTVNGIRCLQSKDSSASLKNVASFLFNLSEDNGIMTRSVIHPDVFETGGKWTMLYHLDGNSGPTDFYNNSVKNIVVKSVEFKPNRLIIFPGIYMHRGSLPDSGTRLVVNIRCEFDTKFNTEILNRSPVLQKRYQQDYISASCGSLLQPL